MQNKVSRASKTICMTITMQTERKKRRKGALNNYDEGWSPGKDRTIPSPSLTIVGNYGFGIL